MMNFDALKDRLVADGYSDDTAYAKIAHDIVLKAVQAHAGNAAGHVFADDAAVRSRHV